MADAVVELDGRGRPLIAEFDARELAVRLFEAWYEIKRPEGSTLEEAIARIKSVPLPAGAPDLWTGLMRMAHRSLTYLEEGMRNAQPVAREKMQ